jgi:conjugative transfer signal peptidase TraF
VRSHKKGNGAVEVANPDLGGAGVEVQCALFGDFGARIGRGNNLNTDLWCTLEEGETADVLGTLRGEPGHVDGFDSAGSGKRTLGECDPAREKLAQQTRDMSLAPAMDRSRRRTHKNVAMLIGFNAMREFGERGISQYLGPTREIKLGLRFQVRQLDGDRHGLKVRQKMKKMKTGQIGRVTAIGGATGLLMLCVAIAAGLRINGTSSFPVGLYLATGKSPKKGDLVFVDPPALPLFALAKERGYLGAGFSPAGCGALIKRLIGVPGDRVTIDAAGVQVNGIRLANSMPCSCDGAGRSLQPYLLKDHMLGPGEVLLMSEHSPISFDARYFGPLRETTIKSVITPLLTWN